MDWVKPGKGADPVDKFLFLLPLCSIIITFIFNNLCDVEDYFTVPLITFFNIIAFAAARIFRKMGECPESSNKSFGHAIQSGITSSIKSQIINVVFGFAGYIPYIGMIFLWWDLIGMVPGLDIGIIMGFMHLLLNMEGNDDPSEFEKMCNSNSDIMSFSTLWRFLLANGTAFAINLMP